MVERLAKHSCIGEAEATSVLMKLRDIIEEDLQEGRRVNIPGIGYPSLSADLDMDELKPDSKVRADYVSVRGIKFRPNADLLKTVKRRVKFEKSQYSSRSYPSQRKRSRRKSENTSRPTAPLIAEYWNESFTSASRRHSTGSTASWTPASSSRKEPETHRSISWQKNRRIII